jgi:predicted GNAT superfamily acetyltransferase
MADGFERDFYGEMDDTLNAGERSDRLLVRWDFANETRAPSEADPDSGFQVLGIAGDVAKPNPSSVRPPPGDGLAVIRIPADYAALREQDGSLGAAWRDAVADAIEDCFSAGLVAFEFTRDSVYLFR